MRCLVLGMLAASAAHGAPIQFQSSERQTALLELYTSEGCSSCPPAEAWLSRLQAAPGLWRDFVPLAFHVDYWNSLRWRDHWSAKPYSDRQRAYAAAWGAGNYYTPEFVLNGKECRDWSRFNRAPALSETKAGILKVISEDTNRWLAIFIPAVVEPSGYEVHAALLAGGLSSDVKAGENAGRRLKHDFVALALIHRPLVRQRNRFQGEFILAAEPTKSEGRLALAVWATARGGLEPLQAVGGWLAPPPAEIK